MAIFGSLSVLYVYTVLSFPGDQVPNEWDFLAGAFPRDDPD